MKNKVITGFLISLLFLNIFTTTALDVKASELQENTVQMKDNSNVSVMFNSSEQKEIISDREIIVSEIKEKTETTNESMDAIISETMEENPQKVLNESIQKEFKSVKNDASQPVELETNIEAETFEINENLSVTFDDNFIIVDEFEVSEEREVDEDTDFNLFTFAENLFFSKAYAASKDKIKTASHSRSIYDTTAKSMKLVTAYIAAEFTYNGSKVTARRTGNYMKTENFSGVLISVHGQKSAVQKPSTSRRVAYQEGTATLGFTYKGHGLKFQEKYLRVNVESDAKGNITRNSTLK